MIQALRRIDHGGPADLDPVEGIAGSAEEFRFRLGERKAAMRTVSGHALPRGGAQVCSENNVIGRDSSGPACRQRRGRAGLPQPLRDCQSFRRSASRMR
jgi:hypothetical protein